MTDSWAVACPLAATAGRAMVPVRVRGRHLLIVRDGDTLHAVERACPHEGADLAQGHCRDGRLFCPRHFAWFTLATGEVSPGWSFRPLRCFPVRVEGGHVHVGEGPLPLATSL